MVLCRIDAVDDFVRCADDATMQQTVATTLRIHCCRVVVLVMMVMMVSRDSGRRNATPPLLLRVCFRALKI